MSTVNRPSVEYLCQCVRYEEDGRLFWRERPVEHFSSEGHWKQWNRMFAGKEVGCMVFLGREGSKVWKRMFNLRGYTCYRHIINWVIHNGKWPEAGQEIDHKDRDTTNDRIENLRICTQSQNNANTPARSNSITGVKGVSFDERWGKYYARIFVNGKRIWLGCFSNIDDAREAYDKASTDHFGDFSYKKS